jgi:hypothetical protein
MDAGADIPAGRWRFHEEAGGCQEMSFVSGLLSVSLWRGARLAVKDARDERRSTALTASKRRAGCG